MSILPDDPRPKTLWGPRWPQPVNATFDKFLDLPQELQDHIWHYFCPDLTRPRMFPMIWCQRSCSHQDENYYNFHSRPFGIKIAGLRDEFPSFERSTQSFRIYSAVSHATRERALAYAPDILEFCGCPEYLPGGQWPVHRSNGFLRYNASRDLICIHKADFRAIDPATSMPHYPHIKICSGNGEKRTFRNGRLGPRHVAIPPLMDFGASPVRLAEALSCMFPGCHTFYHSWEPHPPDESSDRARWTFNFEDGQLEEVTWLADSRVTRASCTLLEYWDENGPKWSFSQCWVNAEQYPCFANSLPYRRFAGPEELEDEMRLTEELRKRSFNTSYVMRFHDSHPDDEDYGREPNSFDMIVERVKGLSATAETCEGLGN